MRRKALAVAAAIGLLLMVIPVAALLGEAGIDLLMDQPGGRYER